MWIVGAVAALAALVVLLLGAGGGAPEGVPTVPAPRAPGDQANGAPERSAEPFADPFAWHPDRAEDFARRAARGHAHPLYTQSPGGAAATAARVARWRGPIERAAADAGVSAERLAGLVFLESGGRPDAVAPGGLEGAVGLTQILAETGQNLLGMRVDLTGSRRLTRRIRRAAARGQDERVRRLEAARRRADHRFDPELALQATARYLRMARERFGREDLAFVSYHMGMGNLEDVLERFGRREVSWVEVFFASTPSEHRRAYELLRTFGDDSSTYYWRVEAGREILRLAREDPRQLARLSALHTAKGSAEERLHPADETPRFATPDALRDAWEDDDIRAFPDTIRALGLARDPDMGELAPRLKVPAGIYHGLRPEALALTLYIAAHVRALNGDAGALTVTSTVRDQRYQDLLVQRNGEATRAYSLHTTGWAFDVLREYDSRRQALAFQWILDRLRSLDVAAWVREPAAIHVTAGPDAEALLPLLDRLPNSG